jgi:hypothetical protein
MKKYRHLVAALFLGAAVALMMAGCQGDTKVVNVGEVGDKPDRFNGEITLAGVVGAISQYDKTVVGLMDVQELQCKTGNCEKVFIPVRVVEQVPAVGDEIRATGAFHKYPNGYTFDAKKVKVVKKHKLK